MEKETIFELDKLIPALKALEKSVERALVTETFTGMGNMAVKSYRSLQGRVAQLLPADHYVTDALALDIAEDADERDKVAQVHLAASQLVTYLEGQARGERRKRRRHAGDEFFPGSDFDEFKELGQELRDRIVAQTRETLRRALSNIEIDIDEEHEAGRGRKRRVWIHKEDEPDFGEEAVTDEAPGGRRKRRVWVSKTGETIIDDEDENGDDQPGAATEGDDVVIL